MMKIKYALLICGLSLVTILGGCGSSAADDKNSSEDGPREVIVLDDENDNENKDEALDIDDKTQDEASDEDADQLAVEDGGDADISAEYDEITKEALKAYYEILSSMPAIEDEHDEVDNAAFGYEENHEMFGDHLDAFFVYDINKDGIPELIASSTVNFRWAPVYVYTYADGQAVLLKDPLQPDAHGTFEQNASAHGSYMTFFCDNNHIHSFWRGYIDEQMEEGYAYELIGTELVLTTCDTDREVVFFNYDTKKPNTEEYISYMAQ